MSRLNIDYVASIFKEYGCDLLEDKYVNAHTKMKYKCICGNVSEINLNNFKSGKRCKICGKNRNISSLKYSNSEVKKIFTTENCELLDEYVNNRSKLKFRCECGNLSYISLTKFLQGQRCRVCKYKKVSQSLRLSYEDVKKYFTEHKCELLESDYTNARIPMSYRCSCGNISKICFYSFKNGNRCKYCKCISKGENFIKAYLIEHNVLHDLQFRFPNSNIPRYRFDFAINHKCFSGLIEYQGHHHYYPVDYGSKSIDAFGKFKSTILSDIKKEVFCRENKISLICIPYWDYFNLRCILDDIFKNRKTVFSKPPKKVVLWQQSRKEIIDEFYG